MPEQIDFTWFTRYDPIVKKLEFVGLFCGIFLFLTSHADAYLDPGSGSMVLQLLLGGLAAAAVVIKLLWHRILNLFGIRKKDDSDSKSSTDPEG